MPPEPTVAHDEMQKTLREIRIAEGADALEENFMRFGEPSGSRAPNAAAS